MVLQMRGHGGNGGKSPDHAARTLRSNNYHNGHREVVSSILGGGVEGL